MSKQIKLKKGFDINLAGKAERKVADAPQPETFAYKPTSFHGVLRPKMMVEEGDTVKAGTPILFDKKNNRVKHVAPVSGEIAEIRRGEKRKLLEVVILADREMEYEQFPVQDPDAMSREELVETLLNSGTWVNIVQRPYGVIADPEEEPKAIFISCFDTHPLAPDYNFMFKGQEEYFSTGLEAVKKLTSGRVHLGIHGGADNLDMFTKASGVDIHTFTGPHPAGNVGVHIHHVDPISKGDIVWTLTPWGVIQIGRLLKEGRYDASKMVALVGSEVKQPQYFRTFAGASIKNMISGNIDGDHVRYIAGNVLTGTKIDADGFIGHFDHQVTVIPEGDHYEMFGWIKPTFNKPSFHRAFGLMSFLNPNKEYVVDTNTKGEPRAFVQTGIFERVLPMDILPNYLLKAILAEDYDDMEELGIYELIEEDVALLEYVDVSKHDIQDILREGLDLLRYT